MSEAPGRRFLVANLLALAVAALTAIPALFLPRNAPAPKPSDAAAVASR